MIRAYMFICLFLLNATLNFPQTTYYVSSSQGKDNNSGISEESPWQTISKVNKESFLPGDNIFFKRGDKWAEGVGLVINNSGTEGNRITYAAYGTGADPILSQERSITGTWTNQGGNIWRRAVSNVDWNNHMMWLDDVRIKATGGDNEVYSSYPTLATTANITSASQVQTLNSEYRFTSVYLENSFDLYSVGEPSVTYSSIKTFYNTPAITITGKNHITIQDINLQKAAQGVYIQGSSYITIDNVDVDDVFYNAVYATKYGNTKSNFNEIKNCTLDSGLGEMENIPYEYYWGRGNWGIVVSGGSDYNKIHDNNIKNWHHSGIFIATKDILGDSATVSYNEIYDNTIDFSGVNFGRAFTLGGSSTKCIGNRFYRNEIIHQNIRSQIGGTGNYFYFNIIQNDTLRGYYGTGEENVWCWQGYESESVADNYFFNNTIYTCKGQFVLDFGQRNHTFNNLIVNYHRAQEWTLPVIELKGSAGGTIYQNNYFYSPYVNHSSNEVRYNSTWYGTIDAWNSADLNGDIVAGNNVIQTNPITNTITFEVFGQGVVDGGIDISNFVPNGFKDREGNLVDRANPNVGTIDNSTLEPTGLLIYLQGAFTNGIMNTALKQGELIPKTQPYNVSPWNYSGNEAVQTIPSEIVDWVLVELRSDISSSSIVAKRAAFLRSDGSIVDLDGRSKLRFDAVGSGNYYVVIRHRNHLSVMSAGQVPLSESSLNYDFTTSRSGAYGNDLADLGNGRFAMYAGDGDANGTVNVLDYGTVGSNLFQTGYMQGDLDLNGTVNVLDYGKANQNLLKVSNVP